MKSILSVLIVGCLLLNGSFLAAAAAEDDIQQFVSAKKAFVRGVALPIQSVVELPGFISEVQTKNTLIITLSRDGSKIRLDYHHNKNSLTLRDVDVTDVSTLIARLRNDTNSETKPVSDYIWGKLDLVTRQILSSPNSSADQCKNALINNINRLMQVESIYNPERFAHISLQSETKLLIAMNPAGVLLTRLNRLLLEDAYSSFIARNFILPGQFIVESVADGVKQFFYLSEEGELGSYMETKNNKMNGVWLDFGANSKLRYFIEFKDGYYFGRQIRWDEAGNELNRSINDGSKIFDPESKP